MFDTHYCPRLASVRPPRSPICHSQRAYDAAIWKTKIIWGEGKRHSEGGRVGLRGEDWRQRHIEAIIKMVKRNKLMVALCIILCGFEQYSY